MPDPLDTNVTTGDPDHAGLHNAERAAVNTHVADDANPHATTLQQARDAGSTSPSFVVGNGTEQTVVSLFSPNGTRWEISINDAGETSITQA